MSSTYSPEPASPLPPGVWRASQRAVLRAPHLGTGHPALDAELPGSGWPLGHLIELLLPTPGAGELELLGPALASSAPRPIVLLQPPHPPVIHAWGDWTGDPSRLLWVRARHASDLLWSAEHLLRSDAFAAVLLWVPNLRFSAARRLQLAAQAGHTLCVQMRPERAAHQPSPAPLRLRLTPGLHGPLVHILKRRGLPSEQAIALRPHTSSPHATLACHPPAHSRPGHPQPQLAH